MPAHRRFAVDLISHGAAQTSSSAKGNCGHIYRPPFDDGAFGIGEDDWTAPLKQAYSEENSDDPGHWASAR
jgi:hypothetical protein